MRFARRFLDEREIEDDARSLLNLYNNKAGRKIVKALLQTECKCHGVSSSCTVRTCCLTLPSFRQIGDALMKKYYRARPVIAITPPPPPTMQEMSRQCGNHNYEDSIFGRQQLEDIIRNLPPNHIITRYDCPCGRYTRYFALHQHVMLQMLGARCPLNDQLREVSRMYLRLLEDVEVRNEQDETNHSSDNDDENHYYEIDR
ncbi:Protein Wnt-2 [Melipona quadrifasciata]|uniref:Protein Wnt n=1 Tax=Melipona quadrifasciata TaxID=166423 RepID=A0A0M9A421_9HYME|nr:Protein Wnt-2 [Melipona quadrifasciata]